MSRILSRLRGGRHRRGDERFAPGAATLALAGLGGVAGVRRGGDFERVDATLLMVVAALLMFGAVMVYSASIALADSPRYNVSSAHFLIRHSISMLIATVVAAGAFWVPMKQWQQVARWAFLAGVLLLVVVLVPGVGKGALGARRWIALGPLNLQPSELMKLACVLYAADFTVRKQDYMHDFSKGFLPMAGVMAVIGALLLLQPDLGAFGVIVAISIGILFLGGVNGRLFASITVALSVAFMAVIWTSPWRRERIFAYLDPWSAGNALGRGYQLSHSLIAFGRGEWFGVGLGASVEKLHYLPEAHTDFIVAVIGEELGLLGVLAVVFAYYWLSRRAFEIGRQAVALERTFGGLVAQGVGLWIGVQAFINIGVATGLLPTKGLTLPLMSYGGSALLSTMVALSLLLRVDYENRALMRGGAAR
ncbi:MAG TPA: putative lipid II flippase FtsW [Burkholderiaceae bacterium]|jgi:cell division protein FtsW|nr:putative lipid II flippase FtsW [Burkholderiaceae bacterium]